MNLIKDFEPPKFFLQQTNEQDPIILFRAYADYLRTTASCLTLPVLLDQIRNHHKFRLKKASLDQRGFLMGDTIFINGVRSLAKQDTLDFHFYDQQVAYVGSKRIRWNPKTAGEIRGMIQQAIEHNTSLLTVDFLVARNALMENLDNNR